MTKSGLFLVIFEYLQFKKWIKLQMAISLDQKELETSSLWHFEANIHSFKVHKAPFKDSDFNGSDFNGIVYNDPELYIMNR